MVSESNPCLSTYSFVSGPEDVAERAVNAGVDMEMTSTTFRTYLADAVNQKLVPRALSMVGQERPGTVEMRIARPTANIVIGATQHWSRNVLLWNLAADPQAGPHTNNGVCSGCYGALTIDGNKVTRLVAYYTIAQVSKFVPDGSVRIDSQFSDALPNVAFETPEGKTVLLVANTASAQTEFAVKFHGKTFKTSLPAGSVGTYVW